METAYEISLQLKTPKGMQPYGHFEVGSNGNFARELFRSLSGDPQVNEESVITIELIERINNIPLPLELLHCNCEQLGLNVKLITKEMFIQLNLES